MSYQKTLTPREANCPAPGCWNGAIFTFGPVSWPAGAGRPGYRAGLPRPNYAQARADRGGRDPAARGAGHIPRPDRQVCRRDAGLPGYGPSAAAAGRIAASAARSAALAGPRPPPACGQGQPKPAAASATYGASPGDLSLIHI